MQNEHRRGAWPNLDVKKRERHAITGSVLQGFLLLALLSCRQGRSAPRPRSPSSRSVRRPWHCRRAIYGCFSVVGEYDPLKRGSMFDMLSAWPFSTSHMQFASSVLGAVKQSDSALQAGEVLQHHAQLQQLESPGCTLSLMFHKPTVCAGACMMSRASKSNSESSCLAVPS